MTATTVDAAQFREWAKAAECTALRNQARGDGYGVKLARARAAIYEQAANLVDKHGEHDAAAELIALARKHVTREHSFPLHRFDENALSYLQARAYQFCAQKLNPLIREVQPIWQ